MKPILILAAACAAMLCVSPAEAKLGDGIRKLFNRGTPAQFTPDEQQALEVKTIQRLPRFGLLRRLGTFRSANQAARKFNQEKRKAIRQQRAELKAAQAASK